MTAEQIRRAKAIVEHAAVNGLETEETQLLGWALQRIAELEAGRVVVPDNSFALDCEFPERGNGVRIYIRNRTTGFGYRLAGVETDGHFTVKTWDLTPYMRHCLDTIGIKAIPSDRVLGRERSRELRRNWRKSQKEQDGSGCARQSNPKRPRRLSSG